MLTCWKSATVVDSCTATSPARAPSNGASSSPTVSARDSQSCSHHEAIRSPDHCSITRCNASTVRFGVRPSEFPSR